MPQTPFLQLLPPFPLLTHRPYPVILFHLPFIHCSALLILSISTSLTFKWSVFFNSVVSFSLPGVALGSESLMASPIQRITSMCTCESVTGKWIHTHVALPACNESNVRTPTGSGRPLWARTWLPEPGCCHGDGDWVRGCRPIRGRIIKNTFNPVTDGPPLHTE